MNAILLAAGKGERLKDITQKIPKPMIEFKGKTVLQYNIEMCRKFGITDIFINIHHHADQIKDYFGDGEKFGVNIKYSYEEELLGTSGAVKKIANEYFEFEPFNQSTIQPSLLPHSLTPSFPYSHTPSPPHSFTPFFVIYGDQFSEFDLNSLIAKYNQQDCLGIIAFHYREDVAHSGAAEFDDKNRVLKFIEKPKSGETKSHWVNAGIYLLNPGIIQYIPDGFSDFGKQIFPELLSKYKPLYGVCEKKEVKVFDTPEMYKKSFGE